MSDKSPHCISATEFHQWRQWANGLAIAADVSVSEVDWFLQALTSVTALDLRLGLSRTIKSAAPIEKLSELWRQRIEQNVPVQYLVGKTPWREFELFVTPDVLIPRPETEYLIDLAREKVAKHNPDLAREHWVDLGTGSGAIALGLATIFPDATIHAVDYSAAALAIAKKNSEVYQYQKQIQFHQGNWWEPLKHLKGQVSGMISNPPYIPSNLLPDLQPEVYKHEPHAALDGGSDGLDDIRQLIMSAPDYLISDGIWLIEMMRGQGEEIAQLLSSSRYYKDVQVLNDLSKGDRYIFAQRN
ncbi:MAG: peptide chain release factor N(5)-glutamine methyltransferase [Limnothrix sp.]